MSIFIIIFVIFIFSIAIIINIIRNTKRYPDNSMESNFKDKKLSEFPSLFMNVNRFNTYDHKHTVSIDKTHEIVCFLTNIHPYHRGLNSLHKIQYDTHKVKYHEIFESRILENGRIVSTSSRDTHSLYSILGEFLVTSTGSSTNRKIRNRNSIQEINSLELHVFIKNLNSPVIQIPFYRNSTSIKKTDRTYKHIYDDIYELQTILSTIMQQMDDKEHIKRGSNC